MPTREEVLADIEAKITDKTPSDKVQNTEDGANRVLIMDYIDQEVSSVEKFKLIVLKIERDSVSGNYTVTPLLNDFPSINFTCSDSSTTGTLITADSNVFTANKTEIISGIYNGSGTNIYFFTDNGDLLQTLRILKFSKYDGSQVRPSGFNIKVTIKVYN